MGHTAFDATCIVGDSTSKIESIALWDSRLLVGGYDGSLRIYTSRDDIFIREKADPDAESDAANAAVSTPTGLSSWGTGWGAFPAVTGTSTNAWAPFTGAGGGAAGGWAGWGGTGVFSATAATANGLGKDGGASSLEGGEDNLYVLRDTKLGFVKRPITQMDVMLSRGLLLSLSDGVALHELPSLELVSTLTKTRGGGLYAWAEEQGLLCVARARRLLIYRFNALGKEFVEVKELPSPDVVKTMAWCGESLCIGVGKDYKLLNIGTGIFTEVFPAGRSAPPLALSLPNGELLLGKDNIGVFVDGQGKPTRPGGISWSEAPLTVVALLPYALARLPRVIEVRSLRPPHALVQTLPVKGMHMLVAGPRGFITASDAQVFRLLPVSLAEQAGQLAEAGKFEDALAICKLLPPDQESLRMEKEDEIRIRFGQHLFNKGKYELAMEQFGQSTSMTIRRVLSLFPSISLPLDLAPPPPTLEDPATPSGDGMVDTKWDGAEGSTGQERLSLTSDSTPGTPTSDPKALSALITYLMGKRPKVARLANDEESAEDVPAEDEECADEVGGSREGEEGEEVGKKVHKKGTEIAILLDTAAIQAMVKTGGLHAAKRLLEGQNWCDVASVESMLISGGHYDEVVALYRSHGLHRKALDLLLQIVRDPGSLPFPPDSPPATGPGPLTDYLKELGSKEESLVLEYSEWLLQSHPQEVLQLYSSLQPPLPSAVVLQHLRDHAPGLQAAYLEHMLEGGGNKTAGLEADTSNGLQDELVQLYMEKVLEERRRGGAAWDEIRHSEARTKLLQLLRRASAYSHPEALLEQLPGDALLEERALLLGRLGRHRQALSIFARKLKDPVLALGYCDSVHDVLAAHNGPAHTLPSLAPEATIGETNESIYFSLLTIYLDPTIGTNEFVNAITYATPPPTPTLPASIYDIPPPPSLTNTSERRPSRGGGRKIAHIEEDPHGSPNGSPTSQQLQGAVPLSSWLGGWGQPGQLGGKERAELEDKVVKSAKKGLESDVMVDEALDLMGRRWDHISGVHALGMLPEGTELWKLLPYFLPLLRRESEAKRNAAVVQSLRRSENFQVREALVQCKTRVVRVSANTMCSICRKRVGTSAFAVNPNNTIMHFVCFRDVQRAKSPRTPIRSAPATSAGP